MTCIGRIFNAACEEVFCVHQDATGVRSNTLDPRFGRDPTAESMAMYARESLVEIQAAEFAADDELVQAEEWVEINMAYAFLGPEVPVIVVAADCL